jgi:hypothetical protein
VNANEIAVSEGVSDLVKRLIAAGIAAFLVSASLAAALDAESAGGGAACQAPPGPAPALGSIISSFVLVPKSTDPATYGIYRDASYVYAVKYDPPNYFIEKYTPAGSSISTIPCPGFRLGYPRDEDHTHLGSGYLCVVAGYANQVQIISTSTGSTVRSWTPNPKGKPFSMNITWDGTHYYFNGPEDKGLFYRYTSTGAPAGTWTASGWPASMWACGGVGFAKSALGKSGRYLVCTSYGSWEPGCIINLDNGSCVSTFATWRTNSQGLTVGPGAPSSYGETAWMCWYNFGGAYKMALQVDLEGIIAVTPASIGKIKAIYR